MADENNGGGDAGAAAAAAAAAAAGGEGAKVDFGAIYGALSPENKEFATRRGYIKADGTFADPTLWLEGHRGAEKVMGGEKLSVPNMADEKARSEWEGWDKLGAPKSAKDYQFKRPEMPKGPDGQPRAYDEAAENSFRDLAAKLKMPQFMFDAIMTQEVGQRMKAASDLDTSLAATKTTIEAALRKDMGAGYDTALKQGRGALEHMAKQIGVDPGKLADFASHEFGSEETARLFIKIASMLGEGVLQGGKEEGFASGPAAAKAELARLDLDPEFKKAWMNADHPGHPAAIERRQRLLSIAHG